MRSIQRLLTLSAMAFLLLAPALSKQRGKPCVPYAPDAKPVSLPARFTKLYAMVVENKLVKMMRLHKEGSRITGTAFYIQDGRTDGTGNIEGTIDRRGNLCLSECPGGASYCYHHRATYVSPTEIDGTLEAKDDSGSYIMRATTRRVPPSR